ncbi:DUF3465 domain-containing protein [Marinobacterium marinum]|uniref:DUF3465 domain-containing protein n=1 Tax=Marinobacterium marinum TaxID=2756129 RepID=A0A7W1WXU5_9GAMM|nr:DUF3465 domain-containing protein [Marinobacterium marinum]MBA4502217.1 DUF3465 domain-containing protein [Marinobacterium marinum]
MLPQTGTIKAWKGDRGFGFIKPDTDGADLFVHIRDFGRLPEAPRVGDRVRYRPTQDARGRWRATDVKMQKVQSRIGPPDRGRRNPLVSRLAAKRLLIPLALVSVLTALVGKTIVELEPELSVTAEQAEQAPATHDLELARLYENRLSDVQVRGVGVVERVLPDDLEGSRHQKFILRLQSGQTLLVAHNIDLAPRLTGLEKGDQVSFNGEYEWTRHGGVVHWTHHDPAGRHEHGWLKHRGRTYQ